MRDAAGVRIRRMSAMDLERVVEIAESLREAPRWADAAYAAAMDEGHEPRRVAVVAESDSGPDRGARERSEQQAAGAEEAAEKLAVSSEMHEKPTSGAEAPIDSNGFVPGINPRPTARLSFSAAYKAHARLAGIDAGTEVPAYPPSNLRIVGFAVAVIVAGEAELETIAVVESAQRQGVGRSLLRAVLKELPIGEVNAVVLEVRESNRNARRFYGAHGFEETGRRPRYYAEPEEDAVLMRLRLA